MDKKRVVVIFAGLVCIAIAAGVAVMTTIMPQPGSVEVVEAEAGLAQSLLQSFKGGLVAYVDMNEVSPQYFSDFVVLDALDPFPQTMTLVDIKDRLKKPSKPQHLKVKELEVEFKTGVKAKYILNGDDVVIEMK